MSISVRNLRKTFGGFVAIDRLDLDVSEGEFVALLGPSGSGKTTLLRIIAGLEAATDGTVEFFGRDATTTHVSKRGVGFVFQHFALFRHLSVFENVAFGMRVAPRGSRLPDARIRDRVDELLELVQLSGFSKRFPSQLSGGQRQRVALARALATQPRVLLLDEPFGALDARVRLELRNWMRELHDRLNVTSIMVTHDQEEALDIADRVVIMNEGRIEQVGTPTGVFDAPNSPFVIDFLGGVSLFDGELESGTVHAGPISFGASPDLAKHSGKVRVGVREFDLKLWAADPGVATVSRLEARGDRSWVAVQFDDGGSLKAQFPRRSSLLHGVGVGSRVQVLVTRAHVYGDGFAGIVDVEVARQPDVSYLGALAG